MVISKSDWPEQLRSFVIPLQKEYHVEFESELIREVKSGDPERKILLQEKGDYLLFQPVFSYKGFETTSIGKGPAGSTGWRQGIADPEKQGKRSSFH